MPQYPPDRLNNFQIFEFENLQIYVVGILLFPKRQ